MISGRKLGVGPRRIAACVIVILAMLAPLSTRHVHADDLTISHHTSRDGWDQNEPGLTPAVLQQGFGQLTDTTLDGGQVYAQPVVIGRTAIVATERDHVYGLDAATGAIKWTQLVTTPEAPFFEPASQTTCNDLVPDLGVTATPVVDPATNTVYISARSWDGQNANSAQTAVHALNIGTGEEVSGWPVRIRGTATNDPAGPPFDPVIQRDRAGLLLSGGFVFLAYGSFCDIGAYKGWIASVPVAAPAQFKLYTTEPGSNGYFGGIWQAGGGIVSDGPGRIFVTTGNGFLPNPPLPGSPPPANLGDSVVRLSVASDGTLTPEDFFAPHNAQQLDVMDLDLGSGGPAALPDSFGTADHPHLMVAGGKEGIIYVLDRDNLGGIGTTSSQDGLARVGPFPGEGIFGHPAVWGGDGGYIYEPPGASNLSTSPPPLRAYQLVQPSGGQLSLIPVAASNEVFAFGAGSPIVTSNGTTTGSAVVWVTDRATSTLRAYDALPRNGTLQLLFSATVSTQPLAKFAVVASSGNRIYLGTGDGHLLSFGPLPRATNITPATGPATGGTPVTIGGSFFESGAAVDFGGHLATSVVVAADGTSVMATTPSGLVGTTTVTVTNPTGKTATVPGGYTYNPPLPTGTTFFFAEGNTINGFNETLDLFVPNASGTAQVTYFTESGQVGPIAHAVAAGLVTAVNVAADVGAGHTGVSAQVVLPGPGVAERQLNFTFANWHGSTDKVGVTGPNSEWDFAEGSTLSAFSEYLTLQNPDPASTSTVTLNYFTDQGVSVIKTVDLAPQTRTTLEVFNGDLTSPGTKCAVLGGVAQNCGVGPNVSGVSTQVKVASGPNIIAERPFYVNGFSFGSGLIRDGHVAFGANSPSMTWNFAEGTTLGGFNEYLTLQNPGLTASNVTVMYFTDSGATVTRTLQLPATSRTTLEVFNGSTSPGPTPCTISNGVAQNCGVGPGVGGVSTKVVVTAGQPPIVVERPMYIVHDFGTGVVAGAHVVVGANSLGNLFGFSAAQTKTGENDFLTIQNPNPGPATLTISYYDSAFSPRGAAVMVPGNTRQTVQVFLPASAAPGGIGPGFSNLGIVVSSDIPVLVEKPTYNSTAAQYGATDTLGFTPIQAF